MGRCVRGILPECWCCGRENQLHGAKELCVRCYERWRRNGFRGRGPGPEFTPQLTRARDHLTVITNNSRHEAARILGVSSMTIYRWRKALRDAS